MSLHLSMPACFPVWKIKAPCLLYAPTAWSSRGMNYFSQPTGSHWAQVPFELFGPWGQKVRSPRERSRYNQESGCARCSHTGEKEDWKFERQHTQTEGIKLWGRVPTIGKGAPIINFSIYKSIQWSNIKTWTAIHTRSSTFSLKNTATTMGTGKVVIFA